jgi:hypothetical protein
VRRDSSHGDRDHDSGGDGQCATTLASLAQQKDRRGRAKKDESTGLSNLKMAGWWRSCASVELVVTMVLDVAPVKAKMSERQGESESERWQ